MLDRVFDLFDDLERHRVMLSFKGDLSAELVSAILDLVERKLSAIEPDVKNRRKVFNVVMECLQNLYHHNARIAVEEGVKQRREEPQGVVMIAQQSNGYSVLTGNYMAGGEVERLRQRIEHVNALGPDELRELYKSTLAKGEYSPHGGGGLGLIDIARRSGTKLEYGFVPLDEDNAFFSLNVNVPN
ncbi:MAG: SiaB family protein kinase [Flavobacteriales bacterium]|nr:SiaB family protein kinase [Flavobacteriales bacterium]